MMTIRDKDEFRGAVDALGEDDLAILLIHRNAHGDESELQIRSYGAGKESEFMGLIGYGTAVIQRDYFRADE